MLRAESARTAPLYLDPNTEYVKQFLFRGSFWRFWATILHALGIEVVVIQVGFLLLQLWLRFEGSGSSVEGFRACRVYYGLRPTVFRALAQGGGHRIQGP